MSGEDVCASVCCVAWKINETFKITKLKGLVTLGSGEPSKQNLVLKKKVCQEKDKYTWG